MIDITKITATPPTVINYMTVQCKIQAVEDTGLLVSVCPSDWQLFEELNGKQAEKLFLVPKEHYEKSWVSHTTCGRCNECPPCPIAVAQNK